MVARPPSKLFIDSAALIAIFSKNDQYHDIAVDYYSSLTKKTILITTLLVISETYTWFRYHVNYRTAIEFLDVIQDSIASKWLNIIYPDLVLDTQAQVILRQFQDQKLSYVDAISFAVIENMKIKNVFGFDSHFRITKTNIWPLGL